MACGCLAKMIGQPEVGSDVASEEVVKKSLETMLCLASGLLCHEFLQNFLSLGFHVVLRLDLYRNAGVTNDGTHLQILIGMPAGQSLSVYSETDRRQAVGDSPA